MRSILDRRPLLAMALVLSGCSSPYDIRLSDDRSACFGPLFFLGWADPPLIPGTRLADAPPGSRVVLWNEAGLEAIVDVGDASAVLVREDDGARAPTDVELAVIAAVFPSWRVAASPRPDEYCHERRLERRFPSHILSGVGTLEAGAAVDFALGESPAGWLALGGRALAMRHAAGRAPAADLGRLIDGASVLEGADRFAVLAALVERRDLTPRELIPIAKAGGPVLAARHPAADEAVCLAAVEEVAKAPLSAARRSGLEDILDSAGATARVRERILQVPLAYPEDRDAVRAKAASR